MSASPTNGTITAFSNTPQATDDTFSLTEDQLLSLSAFNSQSDILSLDVLANDHGGNAKMLYSIDDGINYLTDLLQADTLTNGVSTWEAIGGGDTIRIDHGKIDIDLSHSIYALTGSTDINALSAADHIHDTFVYAIQLGNGALSWTSVTIDIQGSADVLKLPDGGATANLTFPGNEFDTVVGGNGFDTLTVTYTGTQFVQITSDGQIPNGHILIDFNHDGHTDLTVSGVEELVVNAPNVVVTGDLSHTGLAEQTIVYNGTAGDDTFDASAMTSTERVVANGYGGNDTLIGAGGNDILTGGDGNDQLYGGDGRDWAVYTDATGGITADLAAGTVFGPGVGTDTLHSIELLRGSNFDDNISAVGFSDTSPNAGSFGATFNVIEGMGGNDTITGNGQTTIS